MIQLLKIEWMKVKAYRTFWILIAIFTVAGPLLSSAYSSLNKRVFSKLPMVQNPFAFPEAWETVAWLTSFMTPVMGILLIILLTNENNFRTIRQNIIDGWSRDQYIAAKFGVMLGMVLFITLLVTLTAIVFGAQNGGDASENLHIILWSALQSLTYLSAAFFLGTFMKRSGIAIAIYVFYAYVGEFMLAALLDFQVRFHAGAFLPMECTDRLLPGQATKMMRKLMTEAPPPSNSVYIITAVAYVLLFCYLSWRKMKKADL
jgi:ABC-type transport system involved in multi-copper enzyme maturation permease subunit